MSAPLHVEIFIEREDAAKKQAFTLDVSFEAKPGVTILFGPSGCGKSTTLAAIAGLIRPARGRIALGDDVWFDAKAKLHLPVHRRKVAYVFQSLALFPHMTALSNVVYGMDRSISTREKRARAVALLDRLHVGHLTDRRPPTFSGGEAQRVALARAFAMSPRIVLLDEPFSALDRRLRHDFAQEVRDFVDEHEIPMIHVTHHRNEAIALGDKVILMDKGRIVAEGDGKLLVEKGEPRDLSFDETPMPMRGKLVL